MLSGDYEPALQAPTQPKARLSDYLHGAVALLAEDNEINQEVAQIVLEKVGLVVDIADNGSQAVDMVAAQPSRYSVVLMDMQMPVMDGLEATRTIREDLKITELPIIAMTAHAFEEEKQKCLNAGMNDHLAKPVDASHLVATLNKWMKPRIRSLNITSPVPASLVSKGMDSLPDGLSGINVPEALQRLDISEDFFAKLLQKFYQKHWLIADDIQEALTQADIPGLERMAHLLKGMASNISANDLSAAAETLETAARNNRKDELPELVAHLEEALIPVLESISRAVGDP